MSHFSMNARSWSYSSSAPCGRLEFSFDLGVDHIASLGANDEQSVEAKAWRNSRDAHHRRVEADLGWTRKLTMLARSESILAFSPK